MQQLTESDLLVWGLLVTAILSAFLGAFYWLLPLALSLIMALWFGVISCTSLAIIILGLSLAYATQHCRILWLKIVGNLAILLWIAGLILHQFPDFNNRLVLENVLTGAASSPFTLYLNIDKPMVFFGLLLLVPRLLDKQEYYWSCKLFSKRQLMTLIGAMLAIIGFAWGLQLVRPEWSLPRWLWIFAISNLLLTCVVEEALFRGYIQRYILGALAPVLAISITSVLFGLAHYAGGLKFVLVASLAGALYGLAYHWTNKLSVAVLVHFLFNMIHLIFFTYPMAAKTMR